MTQDTDLAKDHILLNLLGNQQYKFISELTRIKLHVCNLTKPTVTFLIIDSFLVLIRL